MRSSPITPDPPAGSQQIQSYRAGGFTIAGVRHEGSVLVLADATISWSVGTFAEVSLESLGPILEATPAVEILLLGAGRHFAMASPAFRADLRARGIALESMDTPAACRTFNLLLAEERRVAAALIAL